MRRISIPVLSSTLTLVALVQYTNLKTGPPELTKIEPPADEKKKK